MKKPILFCTVIFTCSILFSQNSGKHRSYIAYRTVDTILIDGIADEASWENSSFSQDFIDIAAIYKKFYGILRLRLHIFTMPKKPYSPPMMILFLFPEKQPML